MKIIKIKESEIKAVVEDAGGLPLADDVETEA